MILLAALAACGSEGPPRSVLTPPTVAFPEEGVRDQEIVWTDLEDLLPSRPASLPSALAGLRPGMAGADARAALEGARPPGSRIFEEVHGSTVAVGSLLSGTADVGVTLLLGAGGTALEAIDLSLPDEVAVPMLVTGWGPPDRVEARDGGAPLYRWAPEGEPWTASLYTRPGERAILKFTAN